MTNVRYYVNADGSYYGSAVSIESPEGERWPAVPDGLTLVPDKPPGAGYRWDGDSWVRDPAARRVTSDDLALAFTPEQGETLISDPKILNMMFRLKARGSVPANDQTLADIIAYVKSAKLLGPNTSDQIDAALAPLLGGE